jgi:hypothetical protein
VATDWQRWVNEEGAAIPIIGCGNPWHYIGVEPPLPVDPDARNALADATWLDRNGVNIEDAIKRLHRSGYTVVAASVPLPVDGLREAASDVVTEYDQAAYGALAVAMDTLRTALAAPTPTAPPALDRVAFAAAIQEVGLPMQYVHRIMDRYAERLSGTEPER